MKVVGLCGGSGSGKGLVCSFFSDLGVKCIDTDTVYHDMISTDSECTKELISYFGQEISASSGIDRTKLREVVFASKENLKALNEITHKHILEEVRLCISETKSAGEAIGIVIDAPLLFESRFDEECDLTVAVVSDTDRRIERIIARDTITREDAIRRISKQIPDDLLITRCDYVLENNSDANELRKKVYDLAKTLFNN